MKHPDEAVAAEIAGSTFGEPVMTCDRFPTGLAHWVYDVVLASGRNVVIRVNSKQARRELTGGLYWHRRLEQTEVPIAAVLGADLDAVFPYLILERLPGTDLGNVYDSLTVEQRRRISDAVVNMQAETARLPRADGFGYAYDYNSPLQSSWHDVLQASVRRARSWIENAGIVSTAWADRVDELLLGAANDFGDVQPTAFLHDVTTKNLIIDDGVVSGIVDVDEMGFGDPLWTTALTRMSLLSAGRPTDYSEAQHRSLHPGQDRHRRFDLYTSLHGLTFLGELGQRFNQAEAQPVDQALQAHLEAVLAELLEDAKGP